MIKLLTFTLLSTLFICANNIQDTDLDGVPDNIDSCPHTPFLNEVNAKGCTTTILRIPQETEEQDSLMFSLSYGFNTNEEFVQRQRQDTSKLELNYFYKSWSISLRGGYYDNNNSSGLLDSSFKIKKRFSIVDNLRWNIGLGVKFPTYDFYGNSTDYTLSSSLNYYPMASLSFFVGFSHTFIKDRVKIENDDKHDNEDDHDEEYTNTSLQDTHIFYVGSGYFINHNLYINIAYSYVQNKFKKEESIHSLSSTFYYKINKIWFATLLYSQELDSHEEHNAFNFKLGYKVW